MSVCSSKRSTDSRASRASSSHSVARREALIESAAAQTALEYEQRTIEMAEQREEGERRMTELQAQNKRQRAANERQMSLMRASKTAAIAKAKLDAIDQAIREENDSRSVISDEEGDRTKRTETWISCNSNSNAIEETDDEIVNNMPRSIFESQSNTTPADVKRAIISPCKDGITQHVNGDSKVTQINTRVRSEFGIAAPPVIVPVSNQAKNDVIPRKVGNVTCDPFIPRNKYVFTENEFAHHPQNRTPSTELRLTESLARQNLPKFEPDVFADDVTLYYTWKRSFRAMLQDANVKPTQEIGFIRKYTSGSSQKLVDSYRRRLYTDSAEALHDIWSALDRKFGNTAAIANAYLHQLECMARFDGTDHVKMQDFADTCADVDSQLKHLPGLMCLNYANVLQPIVDNLPTYLKTKWDKIVVHYANANENAYPTFDKFASLMSSQAELKNHPNIRSSRSSTEPQNNLNEGLCFDNNRPDFSDVTRVYGSTNEIRGDKSCPIHYRKGHSLIECPTFETYSTEERREIVCNAGLCYRCLVGQHRAADCRAISINCSVCGSTRHTKLMHSDNWIGAPNLDTDEKHNIRDTYSDSGNVDSTSKTENKHETDEVRSTYTLIHDRNSGGTSCCKILLIDIFADNSPQVTRSIYAVIDDQSNTSMISSNLINEMGLTGKQERYLLTTCSKEKETKYGRRVSGLIARSHNGTTVRLPSMLECDHIPKNERNIPTPRIARQFPHLKDIADEIPELNNDAVIEIIIGRDAPELLKVRKFRNGSHGAPWAQKLTLGWTISGQVCANRINGPRHVVTHKTVVTAEDNRNDKAVTPYQTSFKVTQNYDDVRMPLTACVDADEVAFANEDRCAIDSKDEAEINRIDTSRIKEPGFHNIIAIRREANTDGNRVVAEPPTAILRMLGERVAITKRGCFMFLGLVLEVMTVVLFACPLRHFIASFNTATSQQCENDRRCVDLKNALYKSPVDTDIESIVRYVSYHEYRRLISHNVGVIRTTSSPIGRPDQCNMTMRYASGHQITGNFGQRQNTTTIICSVSDDEHEYVGHVYIRWKRRIRSTSLRRPENTNARLPDE